MSLEGNTFPSSARLVRVFGMVLANHLLLFIPFTFSASQGSDVIVPANDLSLLQMNAVYVDKEAGYKSSKTLTALHLRSTAEADKEEVSSRNLLSPRNAIQADWGKFPKLKMPKLKMPKVPESFKSLASEVKTHATENAKQYVQTAMKHGPEALSGVSALMNGNPGPLFSTLKAAYTDVKGEFADNVKTLRQEVEIGARKLTAMGDSALAGQINAVVSAADNAKKNIEAGIMSPEEAFDMVLAVVVKTDVSAWSALEAGVSEAMNEVTEVNGILSDGLDSATQSGVQTIDAISEKVNGDAVSKA